MLYRHVQVLVSRYSFIDNVELKNGRILLYYTKDGKQKYKAVPYRADKYMLMKYINSIKKDINFDEREKELQEKTSKELKKKPIIGV